MFKYVVLFALLAVAHGGLIHQKPAPVVLPKPILTTTYINDAPYIGVKKAAPVIELAEYGKAPVAVATEWKAPLLPAKVAWPLDLKW